MSFDLAIWKRSARTIIAIENGLSVCGFYSILTFKV